MHAVDRFRELAGSDRFRGWELVGEIEYGVKIDFFGQVITYQLRTGGGKIEKYESILRQFGWVVVFGVTKDRSVVTQAQWKPGRNNAEWALPPGGIGRVPPNTPFRVVLQKTQEFYLRETGFGGGVWLKLEPDHTMIDSGKFRGAGPDDHGFPAHILLAVGLERKQDPSPNPNEIIEQILVPLDEAWEMVHSGLFDETSAVPCATLALNDLGVQSPRFGIRGHLLNTT